MKRFLLSIFFLISTHAIIAQPNDSQNKNSEQSKAMYRAVVPTDPLLVRVYATPYEEQAPRSPEAGVPGALDETFGTDGGRDLTSVFGANTQAQAIRISSNGISFIAVNDPDNNRVKVGRFDSDGYLDATFGTAGICIIAQNGVTDIYIDAQGRIVVVGANDSGSWIARLTAAGVLDTVNFGGVGSNPVGMSVGELSVGFYAVAEQQSGRLIAVGKDAELGGVIYAFRSDGKLDQSFGVTIPFRRLLAGIFHGSRGKFVNTDAAGTGIYGLAIHPTTDEIYFAYVDGSNRATVAKILADGDNYDINFGPSGAQAGAIAAADRIPSVTSISQVRVAIDQNGKIILACVNASNQYVVRRYLSTGAVDTTFNTDGSALTIAGIATSVITHIMMTQANQILIVGYDNNADNNMIMIRINANGTLDTAFSSTGILPYQLDTDDTVRQIRYGAIHPTGRILAVGYEYVDTANHPVAVAVYGDSFVPEYKQAPGATAAGTLDTTFNGGTSPTQIISSITGLTTLANKTPKLMHVFYQTPGYLLISQGGTSTYITKLNQDLELDTTFNGGALLTVTTGTSSSTVNGLCFDKDSGTTDSDQSFFIIGTNVGDAVPWVKHYSSTGVLDSDFVFIPVPGMTAAYTIAQQSFGRLIKGVTNGTQGFVTGHDIFGNIDTAFGNGTGKFLVSGSTAIYAMAIDDQDRIVVAYKDSSNRLAVGCVNQSGLGLDTTFGTSGTIATADMITGVASDDQVKLVLQSDGSIVVAAATSTAYKVRRYNSAGVKDTTFNTSGELSFQFSTTTGTPKITQLTVESSGKILVLGYNNLGGDKRAIQARLLSSGALDTTFNASAVSPYSPGILEINNGTQDFEFCAEGIQLDRRMMLFGKDAVTGDVLLTRIFGDDSDYVTTLDLEPVSGILGAGDVSLQDTGYADLTTLVGSYKAKVIRAIENGKTLVAIDTGSVTKLICLTTQSTLDTTFSGSGISTTTCPTGVYDMFVDSNGKILVAGSTGTTGRLGSGSPSSWLRRYNADGSNDTTFGTTGLVAINMTAGYTVKDQQGGRVLLGGIDSGVGHIVAYTSNGILDTSFGNGNGYITIGTTGIYNFAIDSDDKIYVASDNGSGSVTLSRYRSNGAGLDVTFGTNGTVTNALSATVAGADQIFVGLDQSEKVLVAGATSTTLKIARYTVLGVLDTTFGSSGYTTIADTGVTLKDFLIGTTGQVGSSSVMALVGYKNLADDLMYIAWLDQNGILDTNYNPTGVDAGEPGTVEFEVNGANSIRALKSGVMLADGRIVVVGYETTSGAVDVPLLMRRYSQRYASQQAQAPTFGLPGTLDPSLNGTGYKALNFTSGLVDQFASSVWSLDNGKFLIGGYGTISTDLVNYHFALGKVGADGVADTTFGTGGSVTTSLRTASTNEYLADITVDYVGRIIAVGYSSSGVSLIRRYTAAGVLDTTFGDKTGEPLAPTGTAALSAMQFYAVGMQLNGRLIAIGSDTSINTGVLVAYDLEGNLDPTFGNNGFVYVDDSTSLHSMVIDADDSILITYKNESGRANITRIQDNGLPYNITQSGSTFGTAGTIIDVFGAAISATDKVKIALDADGKIIVAASMNAANTMKMRRYLTTGIIDPLFNTGSALTITLGSSSDRSVISRLMANNAGQYIIVGYEDYNAGTPTPLVVQVTNVGILDTTFNAAGTPGYTIFTIPGGGTIQKLMGSVISPEGKILAVGQEFISSHYKPFGISMFDTQFSEEVDRAPDFVSEGEFDLDFGTDGQVTVYASGSSTPIANQKVMAVRQLANLKLMTIVSSENQSWAVRVDQDGTNDSTFGSGNGILIDQRIGAEIVNQMQLDGAGNMMIVGTHSVFGGYLKHVLADGTMNPLFGGNTGNPVGTLYNIMSEIYAVAQLSDGHMIVVGNNSGVGSATMITSTSDVDTAFAAAGTYTNGANIASIAVDPNDNVYMAIGYLEGVTKKVRLVKMNHDGVLDATFGTGGIVDNVISNIDDYNNIRITLDADNRVIVAASWNGALGKVGVVRHTPAGIFDDQFNQGDQFDVTFSSSTLVFLTGLVALQNNEILISGYQDGGDSVTNNDQWFVAQLQPSGIFDDEFNTSGQIPGLLTFQVDTDLQRTRHNHDIVVQRDGKIVLGGGESPAANQSTPRLVRILNSQDMQSVPQYPGTVEPSNTLPTTTYPDFGTDGIAQSDIITNLLEGGYLVLDSSGRTNVGGLTGGSQLVVARFDSDGAIDTTYNTAGTPQGVAVSPVINNLSNGGSVAVDGNGKVVIGGYVNSGTLAAARFTTAGIPDVTFSSDGLAQTASITNLSNGGFIAVDSINRILVGGITSDFKLVVARFTAIGDADGTFGTSGVAKTGVIANLSVGGFIITDASNNVFVGGYTSAGALVIAKFNSAGSLLTGSFGTSGIATTGSIDNLAGIGSIDLDSFSRPVIGGFTNEASLVAARFTTAGVLDTAFGGTGITASDPITGLTIGGFVTIDSMDRVVIGGLVTSSTGDSSMVATRFTDAGVIDSTVASGGVASTGTIANLTQGGFITVDSFDRILAGGLIVDEGNGQLIAAKLYSGDEIFVTNVQDLTPEDFKIFHYGNNPDRFRRMILVDYLLSLIADGTVNAAVTAEINAILSDYIAQYGGVLGYNLVWSLFRKDLEFEAARLRLLDAHPLAGIVIGNFFTRFNNRRTQLRRL